MSKVRSTIVKFLVGFLTIALARVNALAEAVGTAGAANTRSAGTTPGGGQRVIHLGEQIVRDERIETSDSGSVQVIFVDKTTLSIGPSSSLVIDKFVYDPATSTGQMALTLGRGLLRVVGGQATHTGGATVTTPVATIGIRGGIATISHFTCEPAPPPPTGGRHHGTGAHIPAPPSPLDFASLCSPPGTHAVLHFGLMDVTANGVTEHITRPGFGTFVTLQPDATPTSPTRFSQAEVDSSTALLSSRGGQRGGSHRIPTDAGAAGFLGRFYQTPQAPGPPFLQPTPNSTFGNAIQQGVGHDAATNATLPPRPPLLPPPPPMPPAYGMH